MTDLEDEFVAARCSIDDERQAQLKRAKIPDEIIGCPVIGMAAIEVYRGGLYEPRDEGAVAVIIPVGVWDGLSWRLDDLVAFHLETPARWWLRIGDGRLLGTPGPFGATPQRLHATPLDWLQGLCRGLCVLDWRRDPVDLLAGAAPLRADRPLINRLRKTATQAAAARAARIAYYG